MGQSHTAKTKEPGCGLRKSDPRTHTLLHTVLKWDGSHWRILSNDMVCGQRTPWLVCCKETAEGPRRGEGDHVGLRPWWSEKGYGELESSCHVLSSSLHSFTHSSTHSFIHLLILRVFLCTFHSSILPCLKPHVRCQGLWGWRQVQFPPSQSSEPHRERRREAWLHRTF